MALVDEASDRDSLTRGFLFADLRGYTEYVERHGGEAAAQLLDRYRELVREQVARFRGAEIKTEGDSFYVVFPSVSGAVRAGLAIIEVATADSTTVPGHPIRVGIGVHAGETVETTEGYVGSAVNIAARLCSQARAGELLVSDTVRVLTATVVRAQFVSRGRQHLKGIAEPMQVFAVIGSADAGTTPVARRPVAHLRPVLAAVAAVAALALVAAFALGNRGQVPGSSSAAASSASAQASAPTPKAVLGPHRQRTPADRARALRHRNALSARIRRGDESLQRHLSVRSAARQRGGHGLVGPVRGHGPDGPRARSHRRVARPAGYALQR